MFCEMACITIKKQNHFQLLLNDYFIEVLKIQQRQKDKNIFEQ